MADVLEKVEDGESVITVDNYQDAVNLAGILMKQKYTVVMRAVLNKEVHPGCCLFRDEIDHFLIIMKKNNETQNAESL